MFGIYPYTSATPKQLAAMKAAGIAFRPPSVRSLVRGFVLRFLNTNPVAKP